MEKVYLVIKEFCDEGDVDVDVFPCATNEKAKEVFNQLVENDKAGYEDCVQELSDTYYANYEEGCFSEGHTIIRIQQENILK